MKNSKEHIDQHISSEVIIGYHAGHLSNREMHALESHLLECGLCAEAFEGYATLALPEISMEDLVELDDKIKTRAKRKGGYFKRIYGIAAALLVLIASTFLLLNLNSNTVEERVLTQKNESEDLKKWERPNEPKVSPRVTVPAENRTVPENQQAPSQEQSRKKAQKKVRNEESGRRNSSAEPGPSQEIVGALSGNAEGRSSAGFGDDQAMEQIAAISWDDAQELEEVVFEEVVPAADESGNFDQKITGIVPGLETEALEAKLSQTITGTITSEATGDPIPGVLVLLNKSQANAISDENGKYSIEVPGSGGVLSYSFIGLTTQELVVDDDEGPRDVQMTESQDVLSEVVVTSKSIEREKRSLGNAVSVVEEDDVNVEEDVDMTKAKFARRQRTQAAEDSEVPVGVERSVEAIGQQVDRIRDDITEPVPVGGWRKYKKYLKQNLKYPQEAISNGIVGKVIVTFYVEADGKLTFMKIQEGLGYGCNEEAIRLIVNGPDWRPGYLDGENIQLKTTVRVKFELKK